MQEKHFRLKFFFYIFIQIYSQFNLKIQLKLKLKFKTQNQNYKFIGFNHSNYLKIHFEINFEILKLKIFQNYLNQTNKFLLNNLK